MTYSIFFCSFRHRWKSINNNSIFVILYNSAKYYKIVSKFLWKPCRICLAFCENWSFIWQKFFASILRMPFGQDKIFGRKENPAGLLWSLPEKIRRSPSGKMVKRTAHLPFIRRILAMSTMPADKLWSNRLLVRVCRFFYTKRKGKFFHVWPGSLYAF